MENRRSRSSRTYKVAFLVGLAPFRVDHHQGVWRYLRTRRLDHLVFKAWKLPSSWAETEMCLSSLVLSSFINLPLPTESLTKQYHEAHPPKMPLTGHCLCGAVTYSIDVDAPLITGYDHCDDCQRQSGSTYCRCPFLCLQCEYPGPPLFHQRYEKKKKEKRKEKRKRGPAGCSVVTVVDLDPLAPPPHRWKKQQQKAGRAVASPVDASR